MPIRTIRDFDNDDVEAQRRQNNARQQRGNGYQNQAPLQQQGVIGEESPLNISLMSVPRRPGEIIPPIKDSLAPRFSFLSFTFIISIVQVIMFIVSLIVGQVQYDGAFVSNNSLLGPSSTTFYNLGAVFYPSIHSGNVWRLITPFFLHGGFVHIVMNLFFQFRFCFTLEKRWTWPLFAVMYFLTGIGGNFLSANANQNASSVSVGASGALLGVLGADVVYIIYHWSGPAHLHPDVKDARIMENAMELCIIIFIMLINLILGVNGSNVDINAHLGGICTGLCSGLAILPFYIPASNSYFYRGCGWLLTSGWFGLMCGLMWGS